jgi:uncharacterized RDD family membrane protein YckC
MTAEKSPLIQDAATSEEELSVSSGLVANPYASPLTQSGPAETPDGAAPQRVHYPLVSRFWAANIDGILSIILCLVVGKQLEESSTVVQAVAVIGTFFAYFFVTESLFAATPGKWFMGIKVVSRTGGPCTFLQSLTRNLVRLIEANPILSLPGGLIVVFTKHKQRIGDLLAGTVVVRR